MFESVPAAIVVFAWYMVVCTDAGTAVVAGLATVNTPCLVLRKVHRVGTALVVELTFV